MAIAGRHREGLVDELHQALTLVSETIQSPLEESTRKRKLTLPLALNHLLKDVRSQLVKADRDLLPLKSRIRLWTIARLQQWTDAPEAARKLQRLLIEAGQRDALVRVAASNDTVLIMDLVQLVQAVRSEKKPAYGIFLTLDASCARLASQVAPGIVTAPSLLQTDATYGDNIAFGGSADTTDLGLINVTRTGYLLPRPSIERVSATLANIFAIAAHQLSASS